MLLPLSVLQPFKELVILFENLNGFHRGLEQEPTEYKNSYGEADLPCPGCLRAPPDQGQGQRSYATDSDDNKGFAEIPGQFFPCRAGTIQKLTAVLALYRIVLNFFSTEGTFFHDHLSRKKEIISGARKGRWVDWSIEGAILFYVSFCRLDSEIFILCKQPPFHF